MGVIKCAECTGMVSTAAKACPCCGAPRKRFKKKAINMPAVFAIGVGILVLKVLGGATTGSTAASTPVPEPEPASAAVPAASPTVEAATVAHVSDTNLCRAGIALTMGRPLKTISGRESGGIVTVSYVRQGDGSKWRYRCRIEGDTIVWGNVDGRWRTDPADDVIRYSVGASSLAVSETNNGEMVSSDLYPLSDF